MTAAVLTGSYQLAVDGDGSVVLPSQIAEQLGHAPFVLEWIENSQGQYMLVGLPRTAAPGHAALIVEGGNRLRLTPELGGKTVRFVGCGQYFVVMSN